MVLLAYMQVVRKVNIKWWNYAHVLDRSGSSVPDGGHRAHLSPHGVLCINLLFHGGYYAISSAPQAKGNSVAFGGHIGSTNKSGLAGGIARCGMI